MKKKILVLVLALASLFVFASCKKKTYALSFVTNQPSLSLADVEVEKGGTVDLTAETYVLSLDGFVFKGWYSDIALSQVARSVILDENMTVYAKWVALYTINFEANGGSSTASQNIENGSLLVAPTDPTKSGYVFDGWYTDSGLTKEYSFKTTVTSSFTLYAKWLEGLTVTFNSNGGSEVKPIAVIEGNRITLPQEPTKEGYTFGGWFTDSALSKAFLASTVITSDLTLYAKWVAITYTIAFDSNQGIGTMTNEVFTYDSEKALNANLFTRTGYTFKGWNTLANGTGTSYSDKALIKNLFSKAGSSLTLYAVWEAVKYQVIFNKNNDSAKGTMNSLTASYDTTYVLSQNAFTYTGYVFASWNTSTDGSGTSFSDQASILNLSLTEDVTLYAQWTSISYSISFNKNNDLASGEMSDLDMAFDVAHELSSNAFALTGYHFVSWNTLADGSGTSYSDEASVINLSSVLNSVFSLYAQWEKNTYTVIFNRNGGQGSMESESYDYGEEKALSQNTFTKLGYTFIGWGLSAGATEVAYTDGALVKNLKGASKDRETLTLYAIYRANTYTVSFDKNNTKASGSMATQGFTYDAAVQLTINGFSLEGYTFNGWNSMADGSGTTYIDQESVKNLSSSDKGSVTFYAQWKANTYYVSYDKNDSLASGSITRTTFTYDQEASISASLFTKTGYTQVSWNTLADGSGVSYLSGAKVKNLSAVNGTTIVLYAIYTANTYSVKFDSNKGSGTMEEEAFVYDSEKALSSTGFTRIGYTQASWNTQADGNGTSYALNQNVKNLLSTNGSSLTLYAIYTANTYTIKYNSNGGSGEIADQTFTYDKANVIKDNTFTNNGYHFVSWNTLADGSGDSYSSGSQSHNFTSVQGEVITLYAIWDPNGYTLSFDPNGGSSVSAINADYTSDISSQVSAITTSRVGYTFAGWFDNSELSGSSVTLPTTMPADDITYYAKWDIITYSITYYLNGGVNDPSNPATYNVENADITILAPTKDYYTFAGWYSASDFSGSTLSLIANGSTGNKSFYAKWQPITYTITYNLNGGSNNESNLFSYTVESSDITLADGTKTGYTFNGWYSEDTFTNKVTKIVNGSHGDLALYASFTVNSYTITYNLNGGTNDSANPSSYLFTDSDITLKSASRNGYTFGGWYTKATFDGSSQITKIAKNSLTDYTLYAKWNIISYSIIYNTSGTNSVSNPAIFNVESDTFTLVAPTYTGYTFLGWFKEANFVNQVSEIQKGTYLDLSLNNTLTLYAKWQRIDYSITYELNGGTNGDNPVIYNVESAVTLKDASKTGYTFLGWYSESSYTNRVLEIKKGSTGNKAFYAKFEVITYNIIYNLNSGTNNASNPQTYTIESNTITLLDASRTGYTFHGWYLESSFVTAVTSIPKGSTGTLTIYAKWAAIAYSVTYHLDGGTNGASNLDSFTIETSAFDLQSASKTYYNFLGWYSEGTFTNKVTSIAGGAHQDIDLYAQFSPVSYAITYNLNGGTNSASNPSSFTVLSPDITLEGATKTGYTFNGWYSDTAFTNQVTTIASGSPKAYTLYAKYTINQYTVTFNTNGGSSISSITQNYGTPIGSVADPTKTGYTFQSWDQTIPSEMPASDLTINAIWTINKYTLSFLNADGTVFSSSSVDYASTISEPLTSPTKTGYTFSAWESHQPTMPANDLSVAPIFSANAYSVAFDKNNDGATGSMENESFTYDSEKALTAIGFELTGYHLNYWTLASDGSGTHYADKQAVKNLGTSGTVTLYAQWTATAYTLSFNSNGGSDVSAISADYGSDISAQVNAIATSKDYYTFEGWFDNEELTGSAVTLPATMPAASVTYYAKWAATAYSITYYLNGGVNGANPSTYDFESNAITLAAPTRTYYTFAGWFDNASFSGSAITSLAKGSHGDKTFYAKWTPVSYAITYNLNGGTGVSNATFTVETSGFTYPTPTKAGYSFLGWYTEAEFTNQVSEFSAGSHEDIALFARWNTITYQIHYVLNSGNDNASNPLSYTIEDAAISLGDLSRDGYDFAGWFSDEALTVASSSIPSGSTGEKTFYAKFEVITYDIIYNLNSGTNNDSNPQTYTIESNTITLLDASRTCYTFLGWYLESSFVTAVTSIPKGSTGTLTIYAKWAAIAYSVTYHLDGGTNGASNLDSFTIETSAFDLQSASKTYYNFLGWYSEGTFTNKVTSIAGGAHQDIDLYAQFSPVSYAITYNLNGGTNSASNPSSFTVLSPDITLEGATKTGYTFNGWYSDTAFTNQVTTIASGSPKAYTLYAKYTINQYTVTFNTNGGSSISSITQNYGTPIGSVADPTKTGYTFQSWDQTIPSEMPASDLTINAIWTINKYTLSFLNADGTVFSSSSVDYASTISEPLTSPTKTGYTFSAWESHQPTMPANDLSVAPIFSANAYSVAFDKNNDGATGSMENESFTYDSEKALTAIGFELTGYHLNYWTLASDGSGTHYADKQAVKNLGTSGTVTLYAQWTATAYTLSFNSNGGSDVSAISADYGSDISAQVNAIATSKDYYTFEGWFDNEELTGSAVTLPATMPAASVTYYAKWAATAYSITYYLNGGVNGANPSTYDFESNAITLAAPTRTYYTFAGWFDNASFSGSAITSLAKGSHGDKTFYAKWTPVSYAITYNLNGGTGVSNATFTVETSGFTYPTPTKAGYSFLGWYTEAEFTNQVSEFSAGSHEDIALFARWNTITYQIHYVLNSGNDNASNPLSYTIEDAAISLGDLSRDGYDFAGWFSDEALTVASSSIPSGSTGEKTFYAKFEVITYDIIYNLNSGTNNDSNPQTYTIESNTITLLDASRTCYTFLGWYLESSFVTAVTSIPKGSTGTLTIYAKWAAIAYSVTYHLDGGTNSASNLDSFTIETSAFDLQSASKTYYNFLGWYSEGTFTNKVTSIAGGAHQDIDLYAQFSPVSYAITYNLNGGTNSASNPSSFTVLSPDITLEGATKTGYTFNGWYSDTAFTNQVTTIASGSPKAYTLYAKYTINQYTVTFNTNGGSSISSITQNYGTPIGSVADPTKTGYTFQSWDQTIPSEMPASDLTINAIWTINKYTLSFLNADGTVFSSSSVDYASTISEPLTSPTKTGYTFSAWESHQPTMPANDLSVAPIFSANAYSVAFDKNNDGATGSMENESFTYDSEKALTAIGFELTGYHLNYWTLASDGSGTHYADKQAVKNLGTSGTVTLYAQWTATAYTLSFNSNGGSDVSAISADYGSDISAQVNAIATSKDYYTFEGWFDNEELTGSAVTLPATMPAASVTYYAKWAATAYSITYYLNGGVNGANPSTYDFESNAITLAAPTRTYYTFAGWFDNASFSGSAITSLAKGSHGDKTFYAKWTPVSYAITYNLNGGTGVSNATFTVETSGFTYPTPTKAGYSFLGWYTEAEFTNQVSEFSAGSHEDIALFARWNTITYQIHYVLNSGNDNASNPLSYTIEDAAISLGDLSRDGYDFAGWFSDEALTLASSSIPSGSTGEKTFYAKWTLHSYSIDYVLNGGSNTSNPGTYSITDTVTLSDPSYQAHDFAGFYEAADFSGERITGYALGTFGNKTLYAKWTLHSYSLTYALDGGTNNASNPTSYTYDDAEITLLAPTKAGYTFNGWTVSGNAQSTIPSHSSGDITFTANFQITPLTVTYIVNGGDSMAQTAFNVTTATFNLTDGVKKGYNFLGWYLASDYSGEKVQAIEQGTSSSITLYAKWEIITYYVTYAGGAYNSANPSTYTIEDVASNAITLQNPVRTGYTFNGWYSDSALTISKSTIEIDSVGNVTFYSKWIVQTLSLTYELNGGTNNALNTVTSFTPETASITLYAPTKVGYTFNGWYLDSEFNTMITAIETGTVISTTIYAKWTPITYIVIYDLNGGTGTAITNQTVTYDGVDTYKQSDATKSGCVFLGWSSSNSATEATYLPGSLIANLKSVSDDSITLYAVWRADVYTISYVLNGGVNDPSNPATHTASETNDITLATPTRTGYAFGGWYSASDFSGDAITVIAKDNAASWTLYAKWTPITYTVHFTSPANTVVNPSDMHDQTFTYDLAQNLTQNTYIYIGYHFLYWVDGDGNQYLEGASIKNAKSIQDAVLSLTANWAANQYTVHYDGSGATSGSVSDSLFTYGQSNTIKNNAFVKEGYTFIDWIYFGVKHFDQGQVLTGTDSYETDSHGNVLYTNGAGTVMTASTSGTVTTYTNVATSKTVYTIDSSSNTYTYYCSDGATPLYKALTDNGYDIYVDLYNSNRPIYGISTSDGSYVFFIGGKTDVTTSVNQIIGYKTVISGNISTEERDVTLRANWSANIYTISFNANGGTGSMDNVSLTYNVATALTTNVFTKVGYTFLGWSKSASAVAADYADGFEAGSKEKDNLSSTDGDTVTLYAVWEKNTYNVAFDANGGSGSMATVNGIKYDETYYLEENTLSREHYNFVSWNTMADGSGTSYTDSLINVSSTSGSTVTLYAIWAAYTYQVKFDANGGSGSMANETGFAYGVAKALTANSFTKAGYTFLGWSLSKNSSSVAYADQASLSTIALSSDNSVITLYAVWEPISLSISFNANEGSGIMTNESVQYLVRKALSTVVFTKTGYSFSGWNSKADGTGDYYDDGEIVALTDNLTLYAQWSAKVFTVTYNANCTTYTGSMNNSNFVSSGSLKANAFVRVGYSFAGWATSTSGEALYRDQANITLYDNIVLYAVWEVNTYTIVFKGNGGSGTMSNQSVVYLGSLVLSNNSFEIAGYHFAGWATSIDGSGLTFLDGATLQMESSIAYTSSKQLVLYAQWTVNTYSVIFDANGGSGTMANESFTYNVTKALTANAFTRTDYEFLGWNTDKNATVALYTDSKAVYNLTNESNGTITLYAIWASVSRTVTLKITDGYTGGTTIATYEIVSGTNLLFADRSKNVYDKMMEDAQLSANIPSGEVFVALYKAANAASKLVSSQVYRVNTTVYAYYTKTLTFDLSEVGLEDEVIDLFRTIGVKSSYDCFKYVPFGTSSITYYNTMGVKLSLSNIADIDNQVNFFDNCDLSAISETTTVKYYSIAANDTSISASSTNYKKIITLGGKTITTYDLYTGSTTLSSATSITVMTQAAPLSANGNVITIADNQKGHAIVKIDSEYVYISVHATLTNFAITSGYNDYKNLNLDATKYISKTKVAYEVGYQNIFKLRYSIKNNAGGSLSAAFVAKHYAVTIDGVGDLTQAYSTTIALDETSKRYSGYVYSYGSTEYLYIVPSSDSNDLNYDMIKFTSSANDKNVTFVIKPSYSKLGTEKATMIFHVNEGVNVETNDELKVAYADLTVTSINIHSKIIAALSANQYRDYYDPSEKHYPINLQTDLELKYEQSDFSNSGAIHSGNVYIRAVKDGKTLTHLTINGNYFTIDGSNIPVIEVSTEGKGWIHDGVSVEFDIINSGYLTSNSEYAGKWVKNVQTSIFAADLSYYDYNYQYAGGNSAYYNNRDYNFVYGQEQNSVTYNNMYIISNTITPMVNFGASEVTQAQQVDLACYNSGGYNGIAARCCTMNTNNVIIDYATLGIYGSCEGTTINTNSTYIYYSWANSLYCWGNAQVTITNSEFRYSGNSCVWIEDHDPLSDDTTVTNVFGVSQPVVHNPSLTVDRKTKVSNWVVGNEIWFRLFGYSATIPSLMVGAQKMVNGMSNPNGSSTGTDSTGYSILKSYDQLTTGVDGDVAYALDYKSTSVLFNYAMVVRDTINHEDSANPNTYGEFTNSLNGIAIDRKKASSDGSTYLSFGAYSNKYGMFKYVSNAYNMYTYPVSSMSGYVDSSEADVTYETKGNMALLTGLYGALYQYVLSQTIAYLEGTGITEAEATAQAPAIAAPQAQSTWSSNNAFKAGIENNGTLSHSGVADGYGLMELGIDYGPLIITFYTTYYKGYKVS